MSESEPIFSPLLALVREAGGDFAMAVGRGDESDPDVVVDVQVVATGAAAAALVRVVEAWHEVWMYQSTRPRLPSTPTPTPSG